MQGRSLIFFASAGVSVAACGVANAVVVGSGDGSQNTLPAQPPPVAGWTNVGSYSRDLDKAPVSAIYLGNQYVLLPVHGSSPDTAGITFPTKGVFQLDATNIVLKNLDNSASDLRLGHLTTDPKLPALNVATASVSIGSPITMIGFGVNRATTPTYYTITDNGTNAPTFTETGNSVAAGAGGFKYAAGQSLRWGTNTADGDGGTNNSTLRPDLHTHIFQTDFYEGNSFTAKNDYLAQQSGPSPMPEAQGSPGDSGGGVFDSSNHLVGMIDAIGTFDSQPGDTALFGNATYIADLAFYQSQIAQYVPEPSSAAIASVGASLLALRRRRAQTTRY